MIVYDIYGWIWLEMFFMFLALGCFAHTTNVFFPGTPQDASCLGEGWWNHHSLGQPKAS